MKDKIHYEFSATVWQYASPGGWFFITVPPTISDEIRENLKWMEEGWGRLKVLAQIGHTEWQTAIWFDTKYKGYLLPLKAAVRKAEKLSNGQEVNLILEI